MKIYDFETFEENCKNTKVIKYKKWEDVTNKQDYNEFFILWGKQLAVKFSKRSLGFFYFVNEKGTYAFCVYKKKFKDIVEYVEVNSGLEIE